MGALIEEQERYKRFALLWNLVANQHASNPTCTCNYATVHSKDAYPLAGVFVTSLHLLLETIPGKKARISHFLPQNNINLKELPLPLFFICGSTDIVSLKGVLRFFWFLWWGDGLMPMVPGLPGPPPSTTQDQPRKASLPKSCKQLSTAKAKL